MQSIKRKMGIASLGVFFLFFGAVDSWALSTRSVQLSNFSLTTDSGVNIIYPEWGYGDIANTYAKAQPTADPSLGWGDCSRNPAACNYSMVSNEDGTGVYVPHFVDLASNSSFNGNFASSGTGATVFASTSLGYPGAAYAEAQRWAYFFVAGSGNVTIAADYFVSTVVDSLQTLSADFFSDGIVILGNYSDQYAEGVMSVSNIGLNTWRLSSTLAFNDGDPGFWGGRVSAAGRPADPVSEPGALLLTLAGLVGFLTARRKSSAA